MTDKLDLDDPVLFRKYHDDPPSFTEKLKQMHVDINTVLVRPDPVNIRVLALQEGDPATLSTLYLLTGEDTGQQLEDGIHLRRRGFAEKIVGWPVREDESARPRRNGYRSLAS